VLQLVSELLGWLQDVTLSLIQKFLSQNYFLKKILLSSLHFKNAFPFPSLRSQMEVRCQTCFCQNEDGFPKLLRACTVHLRIRSQPEYDGREFVELGTEKFVVTVYIGYSPHHVEWSVTAAGHRFEDTCCSIPKNQILKFSQTRSKFKMNFKFHFKMFVCELISTNKV
jgi:hypothetical protein